MHLCDLHVIGPIHTAEKNREATYHYFEPMRWPLYFSLEYITLELFVMKSIEAGCADILSQGILIYSSLLHI